MTIKWNWGTKIFLVYTGFVVFMLTMVYMCIRQQYDLVSDDYYAQELKYQDVIDGKNNAKLLRTGLTVGAIADTVFVKLPLDQISGGGEIQFYRPDNASFDYKVQFVNNATIAIPSSKLKAGTYKVKATWASDGKPYYNEVSYLVK
jgi:hypothetical protein